MKNLQKVFFKLFLVLGLNFWHSRIFFWRSFSWDERSSGSVFSIFFSLRTKLFYRAGFSADDVSVQMKDLQVVYVLYFLVLELNFWQSRLFCWRCLSRDEISLGNVFSFKTIVLYCINWVVIPQCTATFFEIYCAHQNLDTRPIKFCSEAYFSGLRFINEPEISDSGSPA